MEIRMEDNRQRFLALLTECAAGRRGVGQFMDWLATTDFFTAPASTRFHLSEPGGLCLHSLHVHDRMVQIAGLLPEPTAGKILSARLVALLHDVCKVNFYSIEMRNRKNPDTGRWEQYPFYVVDDKYPFGHGEKSVFLVDRFLRLTPDEALAIRWHMGGFDDASRGGSYAVGTAYDQCPMALLLHMADMLASHIDEVEKEG